MCGHRIQQSIIIRSGVTLGKKQDDMIGISKKRNSMILPHFEMTPYESFLTPKRMKKEETDAIQEVKWG